MSSKEAVAFDTKLRTVTQLVGRANITLDGNPLHLTSIEIGTLATSLKEAGFTELAEQLVRA